MVGCDLVICTAAACAHARHCHACASARGRAELAHDDPLENSGTGEQARLGRVQLRPRGSSSFEEQELISSSRNLTVPLHQRTSRCPLSSAVQTISLRSCWSRWQGTLTSPLYACAVTSTTGWSPRTLRYMLCKYSLQVSGTCLTGTHTTGQRDHQRGPIQLSDV